MLAIVLSTADLNAWKCSASVIAATFVQPGFPAQDIRISASLETAEARDLNRAVPDAARLIAWMPAIFTTYANGRPIFPARSARSPAIGERFVVDADWLWRFGELEVPRHVWNAVRHLWIEPIVGPAHAGLRRAPGPDDLDGQAFIVHLPGSIPYATRGSPAP